jgi:hypothetical protein
VDHAARSDHFENDERADLDQDRSACDRRRKEKLTWFHDLASHRETPWLVKFTQLKNVSVPKARN